MAVVKANATNNGWKYDVIYLTAVSILGAQASFEASLTLLPLGWKKSSMQLSRRKEGMNFHDMSNKLGQHTFCSKKTIF